jgi:hypothetical protein
MTIGPAIDEAAEYYLLPEWSGISTSPSASKILNDAEPLFDCFIQYDIPLKNMTERRGWSLNWVNSKTNTNIPNEKIRQIMYEESTKINDISAYFKIKNTLDFYDYVNSAK